MVKWQGREESSNIEDRRGQGGGFGGGGLGGGFGRGSNPFGNGGVLIPIGGRSGGLGSIAIVIIFIIIAMAFGINPLDILNGTTSSTTGVTQNLPSDNADETELRHFVGVMVKDTEDYWTNYFASQGQAYTPPKVVLYSGQTSSGCGTADASSGPFYCPDDQKVYLDMAFYQQLRDEFHAAGDFAQAYVIAHEVGHHVQDVLGILPKFNQRRQSMSQDQANAYSVKVELQADCFAGMWGKGEFDKGYLEDGDTQEAINAANQIGDDTLTHGQISQRQYTHGSSAQRMQWLKTGLQATDISQCDTGIPR